MCQAPLGEFLNQAMMMNSDNGAWKYLVHYADAEGVAMIYCDGCKDAGDVWTAVSAALAVAIRPHALEAWQAWISRYIPPNTGQAGVDAQDQRPLLIRRPG